MTQLMRRPIFRSFSTSISPLSSQLTQCKPDPLTQINSTLSKYHIFEPELDRIAYILNPQVVSSVVLNPPSLHSGFRVFIWAMKYKSLRIWEINDLVVDVLLKRNDGFDLYLETLEEMRKCGIGIHPEAFVVLISGYFQAGFAEKAVEMFGKMKEFDCKPNVFTYNAILHVMVQKDVVLLALAVYSQMLKFNCLPNVATYSILIDGLCKSGKLEDALSLFDEMTERGILPNTVTYTIVLLGLCQAERPHEARALLGKMTSNGCLPDSITWDGLLAGFCKLGKVDEAFLLLKVFQNQGYVLGINGYSCLIDGMLKLGRFEEAKRWFNRVLKEDNISPDVVLYTIMIRGFCEAGRVKDAWNLFQEMTEKGVVPDTQCYNTLIKGFCEVGLLEEARSLKLEISNNDCFPDTHTNTILICGMCRNGLLGEAKQIFEEMEKQGCLPSTVTFNALIDGLCKSRKLEEARLMFYKMEVGRNPSLFLRLSQGTDRVMDKASLQNLIARFCESGLYLKAYQLLRKLVDNGILPDIVTYNILINGMCRSRNIDGALKIFKELQLKGESPDVVTYGTLINGLFKARKDEEAMEMVEDMIRNGISPTSSIYKSLMTWSCRRRRVSMSFSFWLSYLRRLDNRDVNALRLIEEHFEKGKLEEAVRGLLTLDFETKDFDLGPYTIWVIGLCQANKVDEAMKIFHVLQEFKVTVTPPTCVKLIQACCFDRKLDLAADVFLYALEKGFMVVPRTCNLLLCSMFRCKRLVNQATDLLRKMDAVGFDLDAHLSRKTKSLWQFNIAMQESAEEMQESIVHPINSSQ
ncbi:hypothetical protein RND81_12G078700 [Saponaria officinalis]|uniref:Pentatricopeptide repeat-containing protein n=1 Tax=Saponaria officinalis TaxID=3572 RepID=A0AAW1H7V1_SAPOF